MLDDIGIMRDVQSNGIDGQKEGSSVFELSQVSDCRDAESVLSLA